MRIVTIIISIHILTASLLSNSEFAGMMRMGNLVSHFYHHIEEHNEDINVLEFLALHYFDQQHLQNDRHEHQDLPMKAHNTQSFSACYIPSSNTTLVWNCSCNISIDILPNSFYPEHFFKSPLIDIWQPPKLA